MYHFKGGFISSKHAYFSRYLHLSMKSKDVLPKKVARDFSYTLTYLTLKYEKNRIFHPCRVMFDFYRQALLNAVRWEIRQAVCLHPIRGTSIGYATNGESTYRIQ